MKKTLFILTTALYFNTSAQIITTVAGNGTAGYTGDGGQATSAKLQQPIGVAFDAVGNLYISDQGNHCIRKVSTAGTISTIAGNGTGGYSGDGGQATAAQLFSPHGLTLDAAGNLYIADYSNYRIRMVNTFGIISTIVGGTYGYSGDGGQATAAKLEAPSGVAFDAVGNLYISDFGNNCIRIVNTSGIINTFAGGGSSGLGDGGQATAAQLSGPYEVAFDAAGNMYIADVGNSRIRMVNTLGIISTFAGMGGGSYSGDGGQATAARLDNPMGIAFDPIGNLYISDEYNNRIRMVNTSGIINTIAGNGTGGFIGDGGQATIAELNVPVMVTFDASGNLYIADNNNNRIRKVTPSSSIMVTVNSATICAGNTATLTASGATTYSWVPAGSLSAATGSVVVASPTATTVYTVTGTTGSVTAVATSTVTVDSFPNVGNGYGTYDASCAGICDGKAFAYIVGGTQPYSYVWTSSSETGDSSSNICPSSSQYMLTVTDANQCVQYLSFSITSPAPLTYSAITQTSNTMCVNSKDTLIIHHVTGGSPPYSVSWSPSAGLNTTSSATVIASPAVTTNYTITITDSRSCFSTDTLSVVVENCTTGIDKLANNSVSIYPNPNNGSFVIEPSSSAKQTMQVYDVNGKMVLSQVIQPTPNPSKEGTSIVIDASSLNEGVYNISLVSSEGVVNKRLVIVH